MKTLARVFTTAFFMLSALGERAWAAAGDLDPSFGNGGIVVTSVNGTDDFATSMALQSDGKIVAAGASFNGTNYDFAVLRYNADGSLDTSFNGTGRVVTAIGANDDKAYGVALQSDGKIVVAGFSVNSAVRAKIAVVRYNPDGSLDTTFNETGIVITDNSAFNDFANSVIVQPDGKIVIGGLSSDAAALDSFELVRYESDGTLDISFGDMGIAKTDVGGAGIDEGLSLVLQNDGRLILAGVSYPQRCCAGDFLTTRFTSDGNLDLSFNGSGSVSTPTSSSYEDTYYSIPLHGVTLQADDKIVVSGNSLSDVTGNFEFVLVRYASEGTLDTGFNGSGEVITTGLGLFGASARGVAIQSDGKIVAAGLGFNNFGADIALVRYHQDGSLDTAFNSTGKVTTSVGSFAAAYAVALQSDGKIVTAGVTYTSGKGSILLARYVAEGAPPPPLDLTTAVSRVAHGSAGPFDINLPLTGEPGIECRSTDGNYSFVATFTNNVGSGQAIITSGTATIAGDPTFSGNTMTVSLAGVSDVQTLQITMSGVTDTFGQVLPNSSVQMSVLIGDITADKTVLVGDYNSVKSTAGHALDETNFRNDIDASGVIDKNDGRAVRARKRHSLP